MRSLSARSAVPPVQTPIPTRSPSNASREFASFGTIVFASCLPCIPRLSVRNPVYSYRIGSKQEMHNSTPCKHNFVVYRCCNNPGVNHSLMLCQGADPAIGQCDDPARYPSPASSISLSLTSRGPIPARPQVPGRRRARSCAAVRSSECRCAPDLRSRRTCSDSPALAARKSGVRPLRFRRCTDPP